MTQVPKVLLDEVLGPLPEMPERRWYHAGPSSIAPLGAVCRTYCGEMKPKSAHMVTQADLANMCPDCLRVIRQRYPTL